MKVEKIPDYGAHMTWAEFVELCNSGAFIDSDGFAESATLDMVFPHTTIRPSEVKAGTIKSPPTHVVWFNL